jgi:hypothetical protein
MKTTTKTPSLAVPLIALAFSLSFTSPASGQVQEAWSVPAPVVSNLWVNAKPLALDRAHNVYVSGGTWWGEETTVKYDGSGSLLWSTNFGDVNGGTVYVDASDNVFVACFGWGGVSGTAKLGANGNLLWFTDWSSQLFAVDSVGDVYVGGGDELRKLRGNDGVKIWSSIGLYCSALLTDSQGGVCATGLGENWTPTTVRLRASDGSVIWSVACIGDRIAVDSTGNIYVSDLRGLSTRKLDANDGHELWPQPAPFGGVLAVDSAGNVCVSGRDSAWNPITVKLAASDGQPLWPQPAPYSSEPSWADFLAVDSVGNVYVSGPWQGTVKLAANDGHELWLQPVPFGGTLVVSSAGEIYISGGWWPGELRKYVQTGIDTLSPDSALAGGAGFTLTVNGFGFSNGSTVQWNGASRPTTVVDNTQLTAQISAEDISTSSEIVTVQVTVTNLDGTTTPPKAFTIINDNVSSFQSGVAGLGQTVTVSVLPSENQGQGAVTNQTGVVAQVSNSGDAAPVAVTVASYSTNVTSGTVFNAGSGYVDVQVTGADTNDTVTASFYYPTNITGATEDALLLLYFNGSGWAQVLSSGGVAPDKDTTDNLDGTVSGGRFAVLFDNTSTPKVTELTGTVLAVADGTKPAISRVVGPSGPLPVGSPAQLSVNYMAPGNPGTHHFSVSWGDGATSATVPAVYGTVMATHTYASAGVYTVTVSLTDANQECVTTKFEYVVIYNPNGGFLTGGGWINSPAGAYRLNTALNGKATFGFNSKYHKGASLPTGDTEFTLNLAGFKFKSRDYEWLVVAGAQAQYEGSGTVNGEGDYGFRLTATQGQSKGGGGDKFRIEIWDIATDLIVYDNAYGSPDDFVGANPQVIAGGSIMIHKSE